MGEHKMKRERGNPKTPVLIEASYPEEVFIWANNRCTGFWKKKYDTHADQRPSLSSEGQNMLNKTNNKSPKKVVDLECLNVCVAFGIN